MKQLLLLGALGLVLAVATGLGVHLLTRETIALPVVRLDANDGLAPAAARAETERARTTTARQTTTGRTTRTGAGTTGAATGGARTLPETDEDGSEETTDNSGPGSDNSGRGRGRGRGGDDSDD